MLALRSNYIWVFDDMPKIEEPHKPVMCSEVLKLLKLAPGMVVLDVTIGCGGHSSRILEHILPQGKLIGIDRDR